MGIVAGTVAERCKMSAYLCYSFFLTAFVYPVVVHSIWSSDGFLIAFGDDDAVLFRGVGMIDFAGSGVVHMTGGATALVAAIVLGPRRGRFYDDDGNVLETPVEFPAHSVALQVLGTFILWFGWYGFNPGSALMIANNDSVATAALCAVTTTLAAACGSTTAMFFDSVMDSRITGVIGGLVYYGVSKLLIKLKIDDAVDAIPVHFGNGIWGVIAVGLFSDKELQGIAGYRTTHQGWFFDGGDANLLLVQFCGILWICGWVFAVMTPFFMTLNAAGMFRVDPLEEEVGLDISHHRGTAYDLAPAKLTDVEELMEVRASRHGKVEVPQEVVAQAAVADTDSYF